MKIITVSRVLGWLCIVVLAVLSLIPGNEVPRTGAPHVVEHYVAYAISAAVLGMTPMSLRKRLVLALALILFAGGMEIAQNWAIDRGPHLRDWVASGMGAATGMFLIALASHCFARRTASEA